MANPSSTSGMRRFFENIPLRVLHYAAIPSTKTDLAWLDVSRHRRLAFKISLPAPAADGTVVFVVRQAKKAGSSVTGEKDLAEGSVIAQIPNTALVSATVTTPVWAVIEVDTQKMDINNGFNMLTVAIQTTATVAPAAEVLAIFHHTQERPVTQPTQCVAITYFDAAI